MAQPIPVRLFHITAIANLPGICKEGALLSKRVGIAQGVNYQNIAHRGAQGARAVRSVPTPPGGVIHDYVPFYFAPRSPMLSAIENGKVADCPWRQRDIVHLETHVENVANGDAEFVFYDRNATLAFAKPYVDLNDLDKIDWDLFTETPRLDGYCKYWMNRHDPPRYIDISQYQPAIVYASRGSQYVRSAKTHRV